MTSRPEYAPSPVGFVADHVDRYLKTNGADGAVFNGIECVILTTKGRKSGALRRSPVVRVQDGRNYLVIGSRGGAPEHPQWYFNLLADPEVTIHDGDQLHEMRARVATGAERAGLWNIAVAAYGEYAEYQTRTDREIPVVVCEPRQVDNAQIKAMLDRYCAAMTARDADTWVNCFAPDATQEDPVGAAPNVGHAAIRAFFEANTIPVHIYQTQDPLVVGNEVLAFFAVDAEMDGTTMHLPRIVDHIVLTADRTRFQSLRAFFDYAELRPK